MLKGIHPLLTPDLLHALAAMGHGDEVVIADANFPCASLGKRVVALPGATASQALDAILTRFPLDTSITPAMFTMGVTDEPGAVPEPVSEFMSVLARHGLGSSAAVTLQRQAFYERARDAFVIVRTGELRRFGNILLVKGVVNRYENPRG